MTTYKNKFTDLGEFQTKVLEDDYVFKTLITDKLKAQTPANGNFSVKSKSNFKDGKWSDNVELKFDFPLTSQYFLWYGVRGNEVKLHLDFGKTNFLNRDFTLFTNVKTTNEQDRFDLRVGAFHKSANVDSSARVETNCCGNNSVCLTTRNVFRRQNVLFGFVSTVDLQKFNICRADAILGYESDKTNLYVRHLAGDNCLPCTTTACKDTKTVHRGVLGKVVVDAVYKHDSKHTVAAQVEHNFTNDTNSVTVGHKSDLNDRLTVRNRFNLAYQWGFALKYKVSDLLSVTASTNLDFKANKLIDLTKTIPLPVGFQLDFSI